MTMELIGQDLVPNRSAPAHYKLTGTSSKGERKKKEDQQDLPKENGKKKVSNMKATYERKGGRLMKSSPGIEPLVSASRPSLNLISRV